MTWDDAAWYGSGSTADLHVLQDGGRAWAIPEPRRRHRGAEGRRCVQAAVLRGPRRPLPRGRQDTLRLTEGADGLRVVQPAGSTDIVVERPLHVHEACSQPAELRQTGAEKGVSSSPGAGSAQMMLTIHQAFAAPSPERAMVTHGACGGQGRDTQGRRTAGRPPEGTERPVAAMSASVRQVTLSRSSVNRCPPTTSHSCHPQALD